VHAHLKALLENQIIYISECGTNAFEKEVDGLDGHHITLLRIISTGAQRQTQMQLHTHTHIKHKQQTITWLVWCSCPSRKFINHFSL